MVGPTHAETQRRADADPSVSACRLSVVVADGPVAGLSIDLDPAVRTRVRIGKSESNDLCLIDPEISRAHCEIVHRDHDWLLCDVGSTNGTWLNGVRIKESYLGAGTAIRVGGIELRVEGALRPVVIEPSARARFGSLVGASVAMREVFALLERIADSDTSVVITGETGTGKGALARAIHEQSRRAAEPFVVVDCSAISPTLIESELFGHERGAFTGAHQRRLGALELAGAGTLFLDELDDLRKDLQSRLLRALEDRLFQRLGSGQPLRFGARVLAASKKDLRALARAGGLRDDLYFRLAVFCVDLPALRARREDLPLLVDHFARAAGQGEASAWAQLPPEARERLTGHDWPGNIRELRNAIERAMVLGRGDLGDPRLWEATLERSFTKSDVPFPVDFTRDYKDAKQELLDRFEREYLQRLVARCNGQLSEAARQAGVARRYLYTLLEKHGLRSPDAPAEDDE